MAADVTSSLSSDSLIMSAIFALPEIVMRSVLEDVSGPLTDACVLALTLVEFHTTSISMSMICSTSSARLRNARQLVRRESTILTLQRCTASTALKALFFSCSRCSNQIRREETNFLLISEIRHLFWSPSLSWMPLPRSTFRIKMEPVSTTSIASPKSGTQVSRNWMLLSSL